MSAATVEELEKLAPYVAGALPDERGEVELYCPLHEDSRRSASMNPKKGVWFCHAGCGGGSVRRLVESEDVWVPAEGRVKRAARSFAAASAGRLRKPTKRDVKRWHRRLVNSDGRYLDELRTERGLNGNTARRARLGHDGRHYKIPIFSPERELWNVRTYDMHVDGDRRKIWSVRGMGRARLYPISVFNWLSPGDYIILCEGEWDALLAIQSGYAAVTRTDGAGKPWHDEWNELFADLNVFLCHDRDHAGLKSDRISAEALDGVAMETRICELPFEITPKHGKDLTDYLIDKDEPSLALHKLLDAAR